MPNYVDNKPLSVTKIRVAFECPRLFYAWEQLEKTIYQMIPYKLQQMQKWLTWEKGESNPPPPTNQPHLCQICPEKPKCQNFFNSY